MKKRTDTSKQRYNTQRQYRYRGQQRTSPMTIVLIFLVCFVAIVFQIMWVQDNQSVFQDKSVLSFFRQTFRSQINAVPCHHCGGAGLVSQPDKDAPALCPLCYGLGEHKIRRLDKKAHLVCEACRGMGQRMHGSIALECDVCSGRGVIEAEIDESWQDIKVKKVTIQCDMCAGNGLLRDNHDDSLSICPVCFGTGSHEAGYMNPDFNRCIACGGMGRLVDPEHGHVRTCRRCGGHGLISPAGQDIQQTHQQ